MKDLVTALTLIVVYLKFLGGGFYKDGRKIQKGVKMNVSAVIAYVALLHLFNL